MHTVDRAVDRWPESKHILSSRSTARSPINKKQVCSRSVDHLCENKNCSNIVDRPAPMTKNIAVKRSIAKPIWPDLSLTSSFWLRSINWVLVKFLQPVFHEQKFSSFTEFSTSFRDTIPYLQASFSKVFSWAIFISNLQFSLTHTWAHITSYSVFDLNKYSS